jgi:hypothetical protein
MSRSHPRDDACDAIELIELFTRVHSGKGTGLDRITGLVARRSEGYAILKCMTDGGRAIIASLTYWVTGTEGSNLAPVQSLDIPRRN